MENIFIAIVTDDKEYGRSLSLGMLNVCRGFIIRIFTAEEFLTVKKEYDLVLWDGNEVSRVYGGRIIYLAEKPSEVAKNIATNDSKDTKKIQKKSTKVGRNDLCPCGSGKKYKQCCGK